MIRSGFGNLDVARSFDEEQAEACTPNFYPCASRACPAGLRPTLPHWAWRPAILLLLVIAYAPRASAQPATAPAKRTLIIPAAPVSGRVLECMVRCGPAVPVAAVAFAPDNRLLAAAGYQEVLLWDLADAKLARRIGSPHITDLVHDLAFRPNTRLLAVAEGTPGRAGSVKLLDIDGGKLIASFSEPKDVVYSIAFSPDGKLLAAGSGDGVAYIWNVDERKLVGSLKDHAGCVQGVAFSADGKFIATASADKTAQVWGAEDFKSVIRFQQSESVQAAVFSPDGESLAIAVAGPTDRSVRIRKKVDGAQVRSIETGAGMPLGLSWVHKANRLLIPCSDRTVRAMDMAKFSMAPLVGGGEWLYSAAASADGTRVAAGGSDGTVKLWNFADGKLLASFVQLSPRADDWLIMTAQGYFATTSPALIRWKESDPQVPLEKLQSTLNSPELVRQAVAGKATAAPNFQAKPVVKGAGR